MYTVTLKPIFFLSWFASDECQQVYTVFKSGEKGLQTWSRFSLSCKSRPSYGEKLPIAVRLTQRAANPGPTLWKVG